MITVVNYNGVEYYFDATNACSYQKVGANYVQNENKDLEIILKPLVSYIYGYNNALETVHLFLNTSGLKSGESFEAGTQAIRNRTSSQKILVLRKQIDSQLQMICSTIVNEG